MRVGRRVMSLGGGGAGGVVTMRQTDKADYARQTGLRRGRDIDFLGPYDVFSPYSLQDGDADEWSEEEELGGKTPDRQNSS
jgi:hypothetical protein